MSVLGWYVQNQILNLNQILMNTMRKVGDLQFRCQAHDSWGMWGVLGGSLGIATHPSVELPLSPECPLTNDKLEKTRRGSLKHPSGNLETNQSFTFDPWKLAIYRVLELPFHTGYVNDAGGIQPGFPSKYTGVRLLIIAEPSFSGMTPDSMLSKMLVTASWNCQRVGTLQAVISIWFCSADTVTSTVGAWFWEL